MSKHIYVNGPVNTIRLQNNKIGKVIYLMFDIHISAENQSRCESIRSIDVANFLVKIFDELKTTSNKIYDFMVEREPSKPLLIDYHTKGRYIDQIIYLFHKAFKIDENKNIVRQSNELSNLRLHWIDVRDYVLNITNTYVFDHIPNTVSRLEKNLTIRNVNILCDLINIVNSQIIFIYEIIYKKEHLNNSKKTKKIFSNKGLILSNFVAAEYGEITTKIMYKLLKSYKNKNIQEKITYLINNDLHDIFVNFFEFVKTSLVELEEIKKRLDFFGTSNFNTILTKHSNGISFYGMGSDELDKYNRIFKNIENGMTTYIITGIGPFIMDLFLLRRFLDKDYITNTITYTGMGHSINLIRLLVKYFDFNITNCSYVKNNDITTATNIINASENDNDLYDLFLAPILSQCSDLGSFPKLFD